jgi:hypothetical protein
MNLSLKNLTATTANLIAGTKVNDSLYSFRVEVSSLAEGFKGAIDKVIGSDLKLVECACFEVANTRQQGVGHTVEAFAVYAPTTYFVPKVQMSSTLEKLGASKVAANLYMGEDEAMWKVTQAGDSVTISKEGTDDIEELLASANSNAFNHDFTPIINKTGMSEVAYVADNGIIEAALAVGFTKGDATRLQVFRYDDLRSKGKRAELTVISSMQVVAYEELEDVDTVEEFEQLNPVDYWRLVYSNDPEIMKMMEENVEHMNLNI